jgi:hypothetical protein
MAEQQTSILYIGGSGRSGSTLLLRLLGSPTGHFAVGEVNNIWGRSLAKNRSCGCGEEFRSCDFWNSVFDDAFGGIDRFDAQRALSLYETTQRGWHLPLLAFPRLRPPDFQRRLDEYVAILEALYQAIRKTSGCDVIIDSSKAPSHALTLAESDKFRIRMIHLVRDSRATAYSWRRKKLRIDVPDKTLYMGGPKGRVAPLKVAAHWNLNHAFTPLAARRLSGSVVCRYEDFVAAPRQVTAEMLDHLGFDEKAAIPFISDNSISLDADHTLWGNPDRAKQGVITIRPDMEWKEKLSTQDRVLVTLMTLPWLLKYRYLAAGTTSEPQSVPVPE